MKDLKPCPFCSGTDLDVDEDYERDLSTISCNTTDCSCSIGPWIGVRNARIAWNTRPIEDALRAEIDALLFEWNLMVKTIGAKTHGTAIGEAGQIVRERDALRAELAQLKESLILSHPAQTEEEYAAEMARLNCPLCGGSGHVDDADQAVVAKIKALEAKVQRLEAVARDVQRLYRCWPNPGPGQRDAVIYLAESMRRAGFEPQQAAGERVRP